MSEFVYNQEKLSYSKVSKDLRAKFLRGFIFFSASLTAAIFLNLLYAVIFDTPHERQVKQENMNLMQDYDFLHRRFTQIDTVLKDLKNHDENIYRLIFETEPVNRARYNNSGHESLSYLNLLDMKSDILVKETRGILDGIYRGIYINSHEYRNLFALSLEKNEMLLSIPAIQPIENRELIKAASGFGYKMHPIYKITKFHSGMDYAAPAGTPVMATGNGIVAELQYTRRGSGNTIVIDHGFGYMTMYAHLDKFNVRKGNKVSRGDLIGWVGNTGLSVAPHLHYEVLLNGEPVNPVNYFFLELSPEQYDKMIELSIKSGQSFD